MSTYQSKKRASILAKIPEIQKSIDAISMVKKKFAQNDPISVNYELGDTLFAQANVPPSRTVYLWLGASILMSYDVDEALALLQEKLKTSQQALSDLEIELQFLREQTTTVEVNISRIYNWHVKNKASSH